MLIKTLLGALYYPMLILLSQTNVNFMQFVHKMPGSEVSQRHSPYNKVKKKQVEGGEYVIKRISHNGSRIENTQLIGYKSYQITNMGDPIYIYV
jgi:hypothetical protein